MIQKDASDLHISPGRLALNLLVTGFCSQSFPLGCVLLIMSAMQGFQILMNPLREIGRGLASILNFGIFITGSPSSNLGDLVWILCIASFLAGPMILGLYLKPGWRGVGAGLLGFLGELGGLVFWGLIFGLISMISSTSASGFLYNSILEELVFVPSAIGGIVVILWAAGRIGSTHERNGIGLAVFIMLGMSIGLASMIAIYQEQVLRSTQGSGFSLTFPLSFLWAWLTTIFFPELLSRRTNWRGLLVWMAAMVIFTLSVTTIVLSVFSGSG